MARQTTEATLVSTLVAEAVWTTSRCYAFIFSTGEEDTSAPARVVFFSLEILRRAGRRTAEPAEKVNF